MYKIGLSGFGKNGAVVIGPGGGGDGVVVDGPPPSLPLISAAGPLPSRVGRDVLLEPMSYRALRRVYRTSALAGGCECEE